MVKLAPLRHYQGDFFIADIFGNLPFKDDLVSMEHPIFSLSSKPKLQRIVYERNGATIEILPSIAGIPTIFDKDILLYCGSLLMHERKKLDAIGGGLPPKTLRVSTNDLLTATGRNVCAKNYTLIEGALTRLHGVSIKTNLKTNGIEQIKAFHLIESFDFIKSNFVKDRRVALEITVSDWFYNAIMGNEVLTINRDYFNLKKPLERRIYEIARKHCGSQNKPFPISVDSLYEKSGSTGTLAKFRFNINALIAANTLPDYEMQLDEANPSNVIFTQRKKSLTSPVSPFDLPTITSATIEKGRNLVEEHAPHLDYNELRHQFMIALQDGKFKPKNVNGAFINFIKKKCDIKTIENTSKKAETVGAKETKNPNANLTPEPLCNNDIEEKKTPEKRDVLLAKLEALTKKLGW